MSQWSTEPPAPRDFAAVRLHRVPCSGILQGICTSEVVLGRRTHWDNWRTQPCPGPECVLCRDGDPGRWHGWLSLFSQAAQRQCVVQLTDLAAQAVNEAKLNFGKLRGLLLGFSRVAKRPNARIIVDARNLPVPIEQLPIGIDIRKYMQLIWDGGAGLEPYNRVTAAYGEATKREQPEP